MTPAEISAALAGRPVGVTEQISPLVARLLADNPSPFTYTGTQTYIVGRTDLAIVDPGPDDAAHVERLMTAIGGRPVRMILCTHTHRDHSPAARLLAAATGAPIGGCAPLRGRDDGPGLEAGFDPDYRPDHVLVEGDMVRGDGWTLQALATPGHTSNHLCFALAQEAALFSGDHVMGWSTSVVNPPDGDMAAYMASLERLLARPQDSIYYPAHGPAVTDPQRVVRAMLGHRRMREGQILRLLDDGAMTLDALVGAMYAGIEPMLRMAASRSVLAHLIDLQRRRLVTGEERGVWQAWT